MPANFDQYGRFTAPSAAVANSSESPNGSREAADEKRRRIYYQSLVYGVCLEIEARLGVKGILAGTVDTPSDDLRFRVAELCEDRQRLAAENDQLRANVAEWKAECEKLRQRGPERSED